MFAGTFSAAVAGLSVPPYLVFVGCKASLECFIVWKEPMLGQFATAALEAGIDVEWSGDVPENATGVLFLVPEAAIADPLWSPRDGVPLYYCMA